jgi:CheY-like chemotaxis protein
MAAVQDIQTSDADRIQTTRKHIFAVDGAPEFLELVRALFEFEHYNVTTTNYIPTTFDQIAAGAPDLIIVDLVIGERQGWELLEHLHSAAATLNIPVIVTSTLPELLERAHADVARFGSSRIIAKPFDVEDIIHTAVELIGTA